MSKISFMKEVLSSNDYSDANKSRRPVGVPNIVAFADWDYYYLNRPISWKAEGKHNSQYRDVNVPRGFVTDLASIPRILWPVLPPTERYTHAAIVHDFLYWEQTVSREVADKIFRISMIELGVSRWKLNIIYLSVKFLGGPAWRKNAELRLQGESRQLRHFPKQPQISWTSWKTNPDNFL